MIEKTYIEAEIVLNILEKILSRQLPYANDEVTLFSSPFKQSLIAFPFKNGRESGLVFTACGIDLYATVCENRNSDDLAVTLSAQGPGWSYVTDEEYRNRKYFKCEQYAKTAHFIAKSLHKAWEKKRKEVEKKEKVA